VAYQEAYSKVLTAKIEKRDLPLATSYEDLGLVDEAKKLCIEILAFDQGNSKLFLKNRDFHAIMGRQNLRPS